jgi:hypothetical protein
VWSTVFLLGVDTRTEGVALVLLLVSVGIIRNESITHFLQCEGLGGGPDQLQPAFHTWRLQGENQGMEVETLLSFRQ